MRGKEVSSGAPAGVGPSIRIDGARQNNLKGVSVEVPRNSLVAVTGVSGSGKSSLAFDTLFREGQRRFLETLSAYARQFLGRMEKPDVERIEGLSPAIAVAQKSQARGARSTVGTLTEIYDHLRVLFARAGVAHCPGCQLPLETQTNEGIVQKVLAELNGKPTLVLAPLVRDRKGAHRALFEGLAKRGFIRVRVDGTLQRIEEVGELSRYHRHSIEVVIDRLKPDADSPGRLREAVDQAVELGEGDVIVLSGEEERSFSTQRTCPGCGAETAPLEPRLFSFNSPHGSCAECEGLGTLRQPSLARVVAYPERSVREGALAVTRKSGGAWLYPKVDFRFLEQIASSYRFSLDTPWKELSARAKKVLLHGTGDKRFEDRASWNGQRYQGSVRWQRRFRGVLGALERAARQGKKHAQPFLVRADCGACEGTRIRESARAVRLGDAGIADLLLLPVHELRACLEGLALTRRQQRIARDLVTEILRRVAFLEEVGLGYLTLARSADTLSGGEAQRIRLAAQLGSGLQGVLYVLDEPSIGLHARDHGRLLSALERLRDGGNTVVVVEHDEATLRAADYLIDVGPGAGRHGGHIVAHGEPSEVASAESPTGELLRGELKMPAPAERRAGLGKSAVVRGAAAFNLKGVDVELPLGKLVVIAGVSGSGKSTLLHRVFLPRVLEHLKREGPPAGEHDSVEGLETIEDAVVIDASPIGRTPRSNPATYTNTLGPIRDLFATLPDSRMRGWGKSRFSFNVKGGRCEACGGAGAKLVELQFLAPVTVPCEECGGLRFQRETLEVRYRDHHIAEVLDMTVDEALEMFRDHPKIARPLATMQEIGLGYLTLGQPSTTLSGGEAQRIKLVKYLQRAHGPRRGKHTLYVLDEPTTGLHQKDVQRLVGALQRLVDAGDSVVVIEHNLDVIASADHVVELGPEGGEAGGELVASGTPEEIAAVKGSPTGDALRELHATRRPKKQRRSRAAKRSSRPSAPPTDALRVRGARTHNLSGVDVTIPRDSLTVVTGPSGSGKSSLALDTIFTEGRRRFVESLSTYARQFLGTRDRPPVESIEGLGPAVAVEAGTSRGHPRSTVATTTEIHDHLRVLYSRAGTPRCPDHGVALEFHDPSKIARRLVTQCDGQKGWIVAPIFGPLFEQPSNIKKAIEERSEAWRTAGFLRLLVDGTEVRLDEKIPRVAKTARVDLVIDRLAFTSATRTRVAEAVEQAAALCSGHVSAILRTADGAGERLDFNTSGACPECGFQNPQKLDPRHFSFNTHTGACPECDGLGSRVECAPELLIANPEKTLRDGAIAGKFGRYLTKGKGYYEYLLRAVADTHGVPLEEPFETWKPAHQELIARGVGARPSYQVHIEKTSTHAEIEEQFTAPWPGLCGHIDAWYAKTEDPQWAAMLEAVMDKRTCSACAGERLRPGSRAVTVSSKRLPEILRMSVADALEWLAKLRMKKAAREAVAPVVAELASRLSLLDRVGLHYLTLDRSTSTLSGGEARRVRLSANLGSRLVGVCYVLDEPTVGLHPGDVERLTDALCALRDAGNTVIVVEHDEGLMQRADWLVDMGPGAGRHGGRVVVSGTPSEVAAHKASLTGQALRGELKLAHQEALAGDTKTRRDPLVLSGAKLRNLKDVDLELAFGAITGVCGPSGSGKSTLVLEALVPALRGEAPAGRWRRLRRPRGLRPRLVVIDAAPIGRTPASIPATYTGLMDPLRELFARTPEARLRGYGPSHFSFNSNRGRCGMCDGRGATRVEMQFLADLWLTCEECDGKRFAPEVLEVHFRGRSIADVLDMTVDEALEFLDHQPSVLKTLRTLADVGLGYISLGQSSTTLSGGEAQRIKLAAELDRVGSGEPSVLVLDEPSTGLHASDVVHLARVLRRLAAAGNAVVVIEHHTGLLAMCDSLVELGPAGGAAGGRRIASGSPAELVADPKSVTGPFLGPELVERPTQRRGSGRNKQGAAR